jgi:sortase A
LRVEENMSRQDSRLQRWIERSLLATGLALVLVYSSARIHAVLMYHAGLRSFAALSETGPSATGDAGEQRPDASVDLRLWSANRVRAYSDALAAKLGPPLAVLSISKLGLCVPVFDGTDAMTLNRGAGRISGTARPGEQGNIGIAAHRDGFFRGLKDVALGDRIELTALNQKFVYTVDNIAVVSPSDVNVLQSRPQPSLTLVTCYPFYFVGDAPQRYVVQASLVNSEQTTISELNQEFPKPNKEKTQ